MRISENKRLNLGIFLSFAIVMLLHLIVLATRRFFLTGMYGDGPYLSAENKVAVAEILSDVLPTVSSVLWVLLVGVLLFASLRLSRGITAVLCLIVCAIPLTTVAIPSVYSLFVASKEMEIHWVPEIFLQLCNLLVLFFSCWMLAPLFARRVPEPAAVLLAVVSFTVATFLLNVASVFLFPFSGVHISSVVFGIARRSLFSLLLTAAAALLVYFLLNWILRPSSEKSAPGLDNG